MPPPPDQPTGARDPKIRAAWYAFYFNLYHLDPEQVVPELRPKFGPGMELMFLQSLEADERHWLGRRARANLALRYDTTIHTLPAGAFSSVRPRPFLAAKAYMMAGGGAPPRPCTPQNGTNMAKKVQGSSMTAVTATLEINRDIAALRAVIDPRNWATCSDVFLESAEVERKGAGKYEPVKAAAGPLGQPWNGLLRERVTADMAEFENVLNIVFAPKADDSEITMTYSLKASLSATIAGVQTSGVLRIDEGGVRVTPATTAGWSAIEATKTVLFADLTPNILGDPFGDSLNYAAPATLSMWLDDMDLMGTCCTP